MDELWYPKPDREILGKRSQVSEKQIDYLVDPKRGRIGSSSPLKLKIGMTYVTTNQDIEILGYPRDGSVKARMLETGVVADHFPVRAIISRKKKQPKEEPIMQNAASVVVTAEQPSSDAVTMTSLELVDYINEIRRQQGETIVLRHDDFMRKVPKIIGEGLAPKFYGTNSYVSGKGGERQQTIYRFPKREATLMAMSYSAEISAQVYDKMEALEKQLYARPVVQIPQTYAEAMMAAALALVEVEQHKVALVAANEQLTLAAPKVAFVDNFVTRGENLTATVIGKKLNVSAQSVNKWLVKKGALYQTRKHFCQWYLDKGFGVEKFVEANHSGGKIVSSIYHTPAGAAWIMQNFNIREV